MTSALGYQLHGDTEAAHFRYRIVCDINSLMAIENATLGLLKHIVKLLAPQYCASTTKY